MFLHRWIATILLLGVCTPVWAAPKCKVTIHITNGFGRDVHIASGPVDLYADVRVEPKDTNRRLIVSWDYKEPTFTDELDVESPTANTYDGSVGSTEVALDGASAPKIFQRKMTGLSGGTYSVVANVTDDHHAICGHADTTVLVTSPN